MSTSPMAPSAPLSAALRSASSCIAADRYQNSIVNVGSEEREEEQQEEKQQQQEQEEKQQQQEQEEQEEEQQEREQEEQGQQEEEQEQEQEDNERDTNEDKMSRVGSANDAPRRRGLQQTQMACASDVAPACSSPTMRLI